MVLFALSIRPFTLLPTGYKWAISLGDKARKARSDTAIKLTAN